MRRPPNAILATFPALFLALALSFASACGGGSESPDAGAKRDRKVIVLSPHGDEILDKFSALFEEAYPGIRVIATNLPTGKVLSRLRIDKDSPQVDVWWGGTSAFFTQAKSEGLLEPYRPSWAVASAAGFHDTDDAWYGHFLQVPAVMFNKNLYVAAQMPGTFAELLDPKWNNKIVIREPMDSGTMKTIYTGIVWARGGAAGDPQLGYDYLTKLDAQTRSYLPDPQALFDRIAKSSAGYISLWNLTDIIFQTEANGYPFGYRIPSDPVPVSVDPIGLVKGGPHPEEAKLFYEFVTSSEICIQLAHEHYRILARNDIPAASLPEFMSSFEFTPMDIELQEFDRRQTEWMRHWLDSIRDPEK